MCLPWGWGGGGWGRWPFLTLVKREQHLEPQETLPDNSGRTQGDKQLISHILFPELEMETRIPLS